MKGRKWKKKPNRENNRQTLQEITNIRQDNNDYKLRPLTFKKY